MKVQDDWSKAKI